MSRVTLVRTMRAALPALAMLATPALASPFAQIGGNHPASLVPAKPSTEVALRISPDEAKHRLEAYLTAQGFQENDASKSPTALSYVRFDGRDRFEALADCHGLGVGQPKLWLETVTVDLTPDAVGVRVTTSGRFQVILRSLVSGSPFKLACRSMGALEAQVREALSKD